MMCNQQLSNMRIWLPQIHLRTLKIKVYHIILFPHKNSCRLLYIFQNKNIWSQFYLNEIHKDAAGGIFIMYASYFMHKWLLKYVFHVLIWILLWSILTGKFTWVAHQIEQKSSLWICLDQIRREIIEATMILKWGICMYTTFIFSN